MTEKEGEELVKKGNEVVEHLMETLHNDMGEGVYVILLKYIVARFAASNILIVQELTEQSDIEDEFFDLARKMMAILGKDMKIQSLKNKKNDIEKQIEEEKKEMEYWKNEYYSLKKENERKSKEIEEKKKLRDKLEKEHEELLKKIANSKKDLN